MPTKPVKPDPSVVAAERETTERETTETEMVALSVSESPRRTRSITYAIGGALVGLVAPLGLYAYGAIRQRPPDPVEMFLALAAVGIVVFAVAGRMIGHRDDALRARNQELKVLSQRLQMLSTTDALTGLMNRRAFDEQLTLEVARSGRYGIPLSLIMVDLDYFKRFNDRYGHPAGDEVLRRVGAVFLEERRSGDLVARYGGEELAAILPHTDAAAATSWAERVRQRIGATPMPIAPRVRDSRNDSDAGGDTDQRDVHVTASFGVAQMEGRTLTAVDLIALSDAALYRAKETGRNRVVTAPRSVRDTASRKAE